MLNTASCHTAKPAADSNKGKQPGKTAESPKAENKQERAEKKEVKRKPADSLEKVFPIILKDKYNVAVFLPLYLGAPDRENAEKTSVTVSQDFYKGLLVAADTLKHCGLKMDIHVYDCEGAGFTQKAIADSMKRIDADLMMGPLLESKNAAFIDTISVRNKINHVSPLQVDEHNRNANYYFESLPSAYEQGLAAARMIKEHYKPYKVLLINEKTTKDNATAQAFASCFRPDSITVIDFGGKGATTYTPEIDYGDSAIIFIPSKSEIFVSGLLAQLRTAPQPKIVIGLMQWQFFKTFEADLWEKMDLHIVSPYFVDYRAGDINNFIKSYRKKFNEEPSLWAIIGFDELVYYGRQLQQGGKYFQLHLNEQQTPMLHMIYKMRRNSKQYGWKNEYVNILEFKDYKLQKAAE
jgi:ABC-type branched-subunit amino acid transport system substrate-binding protein